MKLSSKVVGRVMMSAAIAACCLLGLVIGSGRADETSKTKLTLDKAFPAAAKCKRCHERVFEEWETSPLSRSIHSPAFRAALDEYLTFSAGKDKALCLRCHAPHINEFTEQTDYFVKQVQSAEPSIDGVACSQCHLIREVDRSGHPRFPSTILATRLCMALTRMRPRTSRTNP